MATSVRQIEYKNNFLSELESIYNYKFRKPNIIAICTKIHTKLHCTALH